MSALTPAEIDLLCSAFDGKMRIPPDGITYFVARIALRARGMLDADNRITDAGRDALCSYAAEVA